MKDFQQAFNTLVDSRFPIWIAETHEEPRLHAWIEQAARMRDIPLFTWSLTGGLKRSTEKSAIYNTAELTDALKHVDATPQNGLYVFFDAHPFLKDPLNIRLIREIAFDHYRHDRTLLFISPSLEIPDEISRVTARLELPGIGADRVRVLLKEEVERWQKQGNDLHIQREILPLLIHQLTGMGEEEARRLIRQALLTDSALNKHDLQRIARFKSEQGGSPLDLRIPEVTLENVGGFSRLKTWLAQRQGIFQNPALAPNLPQPKGVLLLGVQGGGKSLAAKAIAGSWNLPLLKLDFGALYNKYIGETEKNLRLALDEAERMAPCVLWMDEIEKGLSTGDSDDGVSRRVIGTLLTWMSERTAPIFIVATSNDVSQLPPELLRKGRFDELFFIDLPGASIRKRIFEIHLSRFGISPEHLDADALANISEGFSGAEIEQSIVAAQFSALAGQTALTQDHLVREITQTRPLSVLRAEDFDSLREWAEARCVKVD